jgi:hypothetical protein
MDLEMNYFGSTRSVTADPVQRGMMDPRGTWKGLWWRPMFRYIIIDKALGFLFTSIYFLLRHRSTFTGWLQKLLLAWCLLRRSRSGIRPQLVQYLDRFR